MTSNPFRIDAHNPDEWRAAELRRAVEGYRARLLKVARKMQGQLLIDLMDPQKVKMSFRSLCRAVHASRNRTAFDRAWKTGEGYFEETAGVAANGKPCSTYLPAASVLTDRVDWRKLAGTA